MEKLNLPEDWKAIQLIPTDPATKIYVNVKEQKCSLAPVFSLGHLSMVIRDWLNLSYTLKDLDKKINTLTCEIKGESKDQIRQFDADHDKEEQRKQGEVNQLNEQYEQDYFSRKQGSQQKLLDEIKDQQSFIDKYQEEISMLTQYGQQFYQATKPEYVETENNKDGQTHLRFTTIIKLGDLGEIGCGVGPNKKEAKKVAAKCALKAILPTLYDRCRQRQPKQKEESKSANQSTLNSTQVQSQSQSFFDQSAIQTNLQMRIQQPVEQSPQAQFVVPQQPQFESFSTQGEISQQLIFEQAQQENPEEINNKIFTASFNHGLQDSVSYSADLGDLPMSEEKAKNHSDLKNFSLETQQNFMNKLDAPLDQVWIDNMIAHHKITPELQKDLILLQANTHTALINCLKQKQTDDNAVEMIQTPQATPEKDSMGQQVFRQQILLSGKTLADSVGQNKKEALSKASLEFFQKIFPIGYSYKQVIAFIKENKKPIDKLEELSHNVTI